MPHYYFQDYYETSIKAGHLFYSLTPIGLKFAEEFKLIPSSYDYLKLVDQFEQGYNGSMLPSAELFIYVISDSD